jgi:superfamily II DNA or RNA helicase
MTDLSPLGRAAPELRPYQQSLITQFHEAVAAGQRHILLVCPTGSGKTVVGAEIINGYLQAGGRVLFLAHRREIIQQTCAKLWAIGIDAGVIQAGVPPRCGERVQVASLATLHARAIRSSRMEMPPADLVVVDETHHATARSYRQILAQYPSAVIVGLTATPVGGDGKGLGDVYQVMIEGPPISELVGLGYLVPSIVYAPSQPDLKGIRVDKGDYNLSQLGERMSDGKLVGDIIGHWLKLANRRPTVAFASGVRHSIFLRDEFRRASVLAEHIDASTAPEE